MTALEYARRKLFAPIGMAEVEWPADVAGVNDGSAGLRMRPRDMARFGLLYLRRGQWNDRQIIPAAWVDASTRLQIALPDEPGHGYDPTPNLTGYGYQWWIPTFGGAEAMGFGGQEIIVLPEQDLVVVVTSTTPDTGSITPEDLAKRFIIPAVTSAGPLPENRAAAQRLSQLAAAAEGEPKPQPIAQPAVARQISGKTYRVRSQDGRDQATFSLTFGPETGVAHLDMVDGGQHISAPIGLDGRYRFTPTGDGQLMLRGRWKDERTFVIDRDLLGEADREEDEFTFEGSRAQVVYRPYVGVEPITLEGQQVGS
jgi:hypothetical protein